MEGVRDGGSEGGRGKGSILSYVHVDCWKERGREREKNGKDLSPYVPADRCPSRPQPVEQRLRAELSRTMEERLGTR